MKILGKGRRRRWRVENSREKARGLVKGEGEGKHPSSFLLQYIYIKHTCWNRFPSILFVDYNRYYNCYVRYKESI